MEPTANMARSGGPNPESRQQDAKDVSKTSKPSFQDLQQAVAAADVKVHPSTVRKTSGRLFQEETFALCWNDTLCTLSPKLKYLDTRTADMFEINQMQHSGTGTSSRLWSVVVYLGTCPTLILEATLVF